MASTSDSGAKLAGLDSLHQLKSTEPPFFLLPSPDLSQAAGIASRYLYSSLKPFAPKSPFSHLLTEGFDAEQIWQQIDLQSQTLLHSLHRHVKHFEKNPEEIEKQFDLERESFRENRKEETEDGDEDDKLVSRDCEEIDDLEGESEGFDEDEEEEDDDDDNDGEMEDDDMGNENGVEDKFLKIKELEEYLVDDEEKEYGLKKEKKKKKKRKIHEITNEDEDDEDGEDEYNEDIMEFLAWIDGA